MGNSSGDENGRDAMKHWQIIAYNLSNAELSCGCCLATVDHKERAIWIMTAET
jgi:hypothetical protein